MANEFTRAEIECMRFVTSASRILNRKSEDRKPKEQSFIAKLRWYERHGTLEPEPTYNIDELIIRCAKLLT